MPQTLAKLVDDIYADTLRKASPDLAASIDQLVAAGETEERITQAVTDAYRKATAQHSEAPITRAAITAYIRRAFAIRSRQGDSA